MSDRHTWDRTAAAQPGWFPRQGFMKRWRKFVIAHLLKQCNQTLTDMEVSRATCGQFDVYEFGVFTGRALKAMSPILARHGVAHALWGFDSFTGIPQDAPLAHPRFHGAHGSYADLINKSIAEKQAVKVDGAAGAFAEGAFSASEAAGVSTVAAAMRAVEAYVESPRLQLIPGYFNESLTPSLAAERGMRPALYVDVDVDIYKSTFQALDWLLASGLIVRGTVIGYDDFNYGLPGLSTIRRVRDAHTYVEGEARAHYEIARKWGLKLQRINSVPREGGESGWAFTVVSTGTAPQPRPYRRLSTIAR